MIFLTIGTQEPFDRLVRAVDEWAARHPQTPVFGQLGALGDDSYRPQHCEWAPFVDGRRYRQLVADSRLIVAHAGMGSIITALSTGKPVVILPRKASLGEHRNEHQWATAGKFEGRPGITVVWEETAVGGAIDAVLAGGAAAAALPPYAAPELLATVAGFIAG